MMQEAALGPEHRVSLTRVCLRSGSIVLPLAARADLEARGEIEAVDADRGDTHRLETGPKGRLTGLGAFFEAHGLSVNDALLLRPLADGRVSLVARPAPRSARRDEHAIRRAIQSLLAGGTPRTVEELRHEHGLADDAPLKAALEREPRLARRAGRWRLRAAEARSPGTGDVPRVRATTRSAPKPMDATLNSARDEAASPEALARARDAFRAFGYEVAAGRDGTLRLTSGGRREGRVLVRVLAVGERPDWTELLRTLREHDARRLAIVGDVRDLHPLERPARGARATLWSWDGLERVLALRESVPIGPVDLAPAFDVGGLYGKGVDRFEAGIAERLQARGRFSDVLTRLADLKAPTVFSVAELGLDDALPRENVVRVLETLTEPPFQWLVHLGPGEFALRHGVPEGLSHLASYALSLSERLPDRRRAVVRGDDPPTTPELLDEEALAVGSTSYSTRAEDEPRR